MNRFIGFCAFVLAIAVACAGPAGAKPGPQWAADSPRDRLIGDEALIDVRDPWANLRQRTEPSNRLRGVFDGCPHDFDVLHYDLSFSDVNWSAQTLTGNTIVRFVSRIDDLSSVELDFKPNLTVSSVLQESTTPLAFTHAGDILEITLAAPADSADTVSVDVAYSGTPWHEAGAGGFGGFWFGLPTTSYSMGVGLNADPPSMGRTWFPCYDRPCDKATVDLHISTALSQMAVANGLLVDVDTTGAKHTWNWSHDFPISTYLIAMSVAAYKVYPDSNDTRITYYHHPGYRKAAEVSFQFVDQMMAAFELRYGPYPFDKFAYMTAPKGDMEHQTCVTHKVQLVDSTNTYDDILSHEMAHMWYGDCATYGDWRDVWLSEGFATYSEAVWREAKNGIGDYHNYATQIMNQVIGSGITDGVYDPSNLWGVIAYEKGGSVLHMLRGVLNDDDLFFQALRDYKTNHAYGNAVSSDFTASVNATVGENLDWFFDPWLYGDGHPLYEYGWSFDPIGGGQFEVDVLIRQAQTTGTLFDLPVDFRVTTTAGSQDFSARIDLAEELHSFVVSAQPTGLIVDPDDWILDEQQLAPTSIDYSDEIRRLQSLSLEVPRPNPFALRTELRFYLPEPSDVAVEVFDLSGRKVRDVFQGPTQAGSRVIFWDRRNNAGDQVAGGVYWVRLAAAGQVLSRSVVVID
jgi:aminopeptidase N